MNPHSHAKEEIPTLFNVVTRPAVFLFTRSVRLALIAMLLGHLRSDPPTGHFSDDRPNDYPNPSQCFISLNIYFIKILIYLSAIIQLISRIVVLKFLDEIRNHHVIKIFYFKTFFFLTLFAVIDSLLLIVTFLSCLLFIFVCGARNLRWCMKMSYQYIESTSVEGSKIYSFL